MLQRWSGLSGLKTGRLAFRAAAKQIQPLLRSPKGWVLLEQLKGEGKKKIKKNKVDTRTGQQEGEGRCNVQ